jgi:hypothetical protein
LRVRKSVELAIAALLALCVSACSTGPKSKEVRKPVHPVHGQLLVGGKPAAGAYVFFVPVNEPPEPVDPRPRAEVGTDGAFHVNMYGDKDGAIGFMEKVIVADPNSAEATMAKGVIEQLKKS